jgi:hypothetical protein
MMDGALGGNNKNRTPLLFIMDIALQERVLELQANSIIGLNEKFTTGGMGVGGDPENIYTRIDMYGFMTAGVDIEYVMRASRSIALPTEFREFVFGDKIITAKSDKESFTFPALKAFFDIRNERPEIPLGTLQQEYSFDLTSDKYIVRSWMHPQQDGLEDALKNFLLLFDRYSTSIFMRTKTLFGLTAEAFKMHDIPYMFSTGKRVETNHQNGVDFATGNGLRVRY